MEGLWPGYKRSWSLLNSTGREHAVITLVLSQSTGAQTRTFQFCGGEQQLKKCLVPLKQRTCKLKFSLKFHSSASSALALERQCPCGLLGERNSGRKSRKGRRGGGDAKKRKERFRINISQLISNQGQDRRGWKTCSEGMNGGAFFSSAMQ